MRVAFVLGLHVLFFAQAGTGVCASIDEPPRSAEAIRRQIREGQYGAAETEARQALEQADARGHDAVERDALLDCLVEARWRGGKAADGETRQLAERAVREKEARLGPRHAEVAASLNNLAVILYLTDDYAAARGLYERALAIREEAFGPDHKDVATSLNNLAVLLEELGDPAALTLHERAAAIRARVLGPDSPELAQSLLNLALLHLKNGRFDAAEPLAQRAVDVRERALGREHPLVAEALSTVNVIAYETGRYAEARHACERALAIREKALGADHPEVAASVTNLANLLWDSGDYVGARSLYERALSIVERAYGPNDDEVAMALNNLGSALADLGDAEAAVQHYRRSLAIREKAFGSSHPVVARTLVNLGLFFRSQGDETQARPTLEKALAIREQSLEPGHPLVAESLENTAVYLEANGDVSQSRDRREQALRIWEERLGREHPLVAVALGGLAALDIGEGALEQAQSRFNRALAVREKALGSSHPLVAESLAGLASVQYLRGEHRSAKDMALRADSVRREHLRDTVQYLPEPQAVRFAALGASGRDIAIAASLETGDGQVRDVWDSVIRSRALILDEIAARHRVATQATDPQLVEATRRLAEARRHLARLFVHELGEGVPVGYPSRVAAAREKKNRLEREVAERSQLFREQEQRTAAGIDDVFRAVPTGSALVAFVLYERPAARKGARREQAYVAFVVRAGEASPVVVSIGASDVVDRAVAGWTRAIRQAMVSADDTALGERNTRRLGTALRERIWDPLGQHLNGVSRIFVVPDGSLNLVNFQALPMAATRYLVDTGLSFHYLSAERDILPRHTAERGEGLLAVASPAFDRSSTAVELSKVSGTRPSRSACADVRTLRFGPLPAAMREVEGLRDVWSRSTHRRDGELARVLSGSDAGEDAVRRMCRGQRILHFATHGFFLTPLCPAARERSAASFLLLSGLALAGANGRSLGEADDGLLMAEEIASLDLAGVEWAVLSACDTGTGEVAAGEGVFGLRRAFHVAGVGTVIMSLWPVEELAARRWMNVLYARRMTDGMDTVSAVQHATKESLQWLRRKGRSTHPIFWAGFVASGDWR